MERNCALGGGRLASQSPSSGAPELLPPLHTGLAEASCWGLRADPCAPGHRLKSHSQVRCGAHPSAKDSLRPGAAACKPPLLEQRRRRERSEALLGSSSYLLHPGNPESWVAASSPKTLQAALPVGSTAQHSTAGVLLSESSAAAAAAAARRCRGKSCAHACLRTQTHARAAPQRARQKLCSLLRERLALDLLQTRLSAAAPPRALRNPAPNWPVICARPAPPTRRPAPPTRRPSSHLDAAAVQAPPRRFGSLPGRTPLASRGVNQSPPPPPRATAAAARSNLGAAERVDARWGANLRTAAEARAEEGWEARGGG